MARNIEIGKDYILNEDIKDFIISVKSGQAIYKPIPAGTRCTVIRKDDDSDFVTLLFPNGRRVRTEAHMIDEESDWYV